MNPDGILRGLAYLVDCLIVFLIFAVTQLIVFVPVRGLIGMTDEWFRSGLATEIYTIVTISIPVWLYFSMMESSRWQATCGKRLFGLRVGDREDSSRLSFWRSMGRTVVKLLPWEIAHLANNLPEPIWYVDKPSFRIGFVLSGVLMAIYVVLVVFRSKGQGMHDMVTRSVVTRLRNQLDNAPKAETGEASA